VLDYDSTKKSSAEKPIPLTDLYGKVVGSKVRFFLDASNDVERTEGIDDLEKHLSSGVSANTSPLSRVPFSEEYLEEMMNGLHSWMPSRAVQPGDSWSVQRAMVMGPYGTVNADYTVSFRGWEEHEKHNCARLEVQCVVSDRPPISTPAGGVASFEGNVSAVSWFDPQLGLGIETVERSYMKLSLNTPPKPGATPGSSGSVQRSHYLWSEVKTTKLEM
jgi:Family of unknown function (DUF6263)